MKSITDSILEIGSRLHQRGYLAAADGNISYRESDDEILITPTGKSKGFLNAKDLATINLAGQVLNGQPSGERLMHLEIYRRCSEAKAVVHAHPPTAIALSIAKPEWRELPVDIMSELILAAGRIPIAPYARPGTAAMGDVLKPFLPDSRIMILSRHGALAWGESLDEAYFGMERLEHTCLVLFQALTLGSLTSLPSAEVEFLQAQRRTLGKKIL